MITPVDKLAEQQARKVPAWNPDTRRHAWQDIDEDGHHHKCFHCWVAYHSEPDGAGYIKVWSHGSRSGRSTSMGKCPGPDGRPTLTVVPALEPADGELPPCTRCAPPCGRTGHLTLGGPTCDEGRAVLAGKRAAHLRELKSATSGLGVPTWRGGAA